MYLQSGSPSSTLDYEAESTSTDELNSVDKSLLAEVTFAIQNLKSGHWTVS